MDFSKVQLKHVSKTAIHDTSAVNKTHIKSKDEEEKQKLEYNDKIRQFDIEKWFEPLQPYTYPSHFVSLSTEEADVIMKAFKFGHNLNPDQKQIYDNLSEKIDKVIRNLPIKAAFCKLSSRSPKDATVDGKRTRAILSTLLKGKTNPSVNEKLIALNQAHIEALKISSGQECLELFCQSERIYEDLELAFEDKKNWNQEVVIRDWVSVPISHEFRGFIRGKKFNALSQYYHSCFFEDVYKNRDAIAKKCQDFYESIKDIIPLENLVLDFAVDEKNNKVYVIEINPFNDYEGCGTSGAMFDWKKDRQILDNGPFEFRVETNPKTELLPILGQQWKNLILEMYPNTN